MKIKKRYRLFIAVLLLIFASSLVLADGMIFIDYSDLAVTMPGQKAAIAWDGEKEEMILSTKIETSDLANLAWVIPIPSKEKPEVNEGDIDIFYDLGDIFYAEEEAPSGFFLGTSNSMEGPALEVVESKKVDIYDITILKATDASVLVDWLNNNGYNVPEATIPVLQEYCDQEDFYFIANKVNLANKYGDLEISYLDKRCVEELRDYYEYSHMGVEEFIEDVYTNFEVYNIDECEGVNIEAVKVFFELSQGIATPIKIEFWPKAPFYPLKISSMNKGWTDVDVYFFSRTPVKDDSNMLTINSMVKTDPREKKEFRIKYGFDYDYITYLTFSGGTDKLNADSWFVNEKYSKKLDPGYVIPGKKILDGIIFILSALFILLTGILYYGRYIILLVLIIIGIRWFIKKSKGKNKKKKVRKRRVKK